MELKITFKQGDNAQTLKFSGDPGEIVESFTKRVAGVWGDLKKFVDTPSDV